MQMQSVETKAGRAISLRAIEDCLDVRFAEPHMAVDVFDLTVASSTRMPTASASPPSVIRLIVSPSALRTASEVRTESGIEIAMMSVLRHEPRNSRIIIAVRHAAITPSRTTPLIAALTKMRLIGELLHLQIVGDGFHHVRHGGFDAVGDLEREALPFLRMLKQGAANAVLPDDVLLGHDSRREPGRRRGCE